MLFSSALVGVFTLGCPDEARDCDDQAENDITPQQTEECSEEQREHAVPEHTHALEERAARVWLWVRIEEQIGLSWVWVLPPELNSPDGNGVGTGMGRYGYDMVWVWLWVFSHVSSEEDGIDGDDCGAEPDDHEDRREHKRGLVGRGTRTKDAAVT